MLLFFAANIIRAETNTFRFQTITLPAGGSASRFVDVDNDGRSDLLVIDPVEKKLWIYRQRTFGFTNTPDQVLGLAPTTAWVAAYDVDPHPGVELLLSTAKGLFYHRQNGGVFEAEERMLIKADQVFTNEDSPVLVSFGATNAIPVISADHAVLYRRNGTFDWTPRQSITLTSQDSRWSSGRNEWTIGPNSSHSLNVQRSFRSERDKAADQPENEAVRKIFEEMKKAISPYLAGTNRFDVNGDGRIDLVLWEFFPGLDPKTDIYLFLRGADGKLPETPTQILHCRGVPIPIGSTQPPLSPVADLKADGTYQIVLVELATSITSASSLLDMAMSGGLDCALTVRAFNGARFSGTPDASVSIRTIMPIVTLAPVEDMNYWLFFICGDFNGDGRPDLLVKRSATQWSILYSTADGRWFTPQPVITFETPMQGEFEIRDLDGDGRSDIILRAHDEPRIFVYLSKPESAKGTHP